jgi:hypothetical protein
MFANIPCWFYEEHRRSSTLQKSSLAITDQSRRLLKYSTDCTQQGHSRTTSVQQAKDPTFSAHFKKSLFRRTMILCRVKMIPESIDEHMARYNEGPSVLDDKVISIDREDLLNVPPLLSPQPMQRSVKKIGAPYLLQLAPQKDPHSSMNGKPAVPEKKNLRPTRRRSGSGSEAGSRRAIFSHYWKKESSSSAKNTLSNGLTINKSTISSPIQRMPTPPRATRKRSSSLSILESAALPEARDYRMFSPPKEHASAIANRFASIFDVPLNSMESLPPLPSPLRRLCSEGNSTGTRSLHGMYPLVKPVPILRQSSYRSLLPPRTSSAPATAIKPSLQELFSGSFNLTQSLRIQNDEILHDLESSSTSSSETIRNVKFDPRVTITEFEDNVERQWYNEFELEVLKHETVVLAQEYLMAHPKETERYSRAKMDQVTGTLRKKALFSLPILSSIVDGSLPKVEGSDYQLLLESQVKNILCVDPNKQILDLFEKSMNLIFPHARVTTTQNGEEALRLITAELQRGYGSLAQHRNFDIIIVEQRLYPSLKNVAQTRDTTGLTPAASCCNMAEVSSDDGHRRVLRKPNSFNYVETMRRAPDGTVNMFGSELLRAICEMEDEVFEDAARDKNSSTTYEAMAAAISSRIEWRALLIGVSAQPDRDAKTLRENGADFVWGKPIPSVGGALRNQLLSAIISKRRRSLEGPE